MGTLAVEVTMPPFNLADHWVPTPVSPGPLGYQIPLHPNAHRRHFDAPQSADLLWRLIEKHSEVREVGIKHFSGSDDERLLLWSTLRGLITQARLHYDAAVAMSGPSAGLLYYYCFFNLAKAELLVADPSSVFDLSAKALVWRQHGLSYDPTQSTGFDHDSLRVMRSGIFPLLYEKRIGRSLSPQSVDVLRLFQQLPEMGSELDDLELPRSTCGLIRHAVSASLSPSGSSELRSLFAVRFPVGLQDAATADYLKQQYRPITMGQPEATRLFGITGWDALFSIMGESLNARQLMSSYAIHSHETESLITPCFEHLRETLDINPYTGEFTVFTPSLDPLTMTPLPPSLASYALMYYVSSVVRYKPHQIYAETNGRERWLLNAYVEQACPRLLLAALNGISGEQHLFSRN